MTNGWAMKEFFEESQRKGQTPNWTMANFSAESLTLRYRMSNRSNSNDSLHGALVIPVISRSIATKSASRTWRRSSAKVDSKLDLVTFLMAKLVLAEDDKVEEENGRIEDVRVRVLESTLTIHCFFITCCCSYAPSVICLWAQSTSQSLGGGGMEFKIYARKRKECNLFIFCLC